MGHKPPVGLASDAPLIVLDSKDEAPACVKKPTVTYKCCVSDEHGTASVHVVVKTPHALLIPSAR